MKSIFNKEQQDYIVKNYLILSYKEIGSNLGFTERQIRGWLNNHGYNKNRKINDKYFDCIDTPLKAYYLGLIYADGWICANSNTRNYEFGIELQSEDKYILEKLNNELGGYNIISHKEPQIRSINGYKANSGHSDVLRIYSKPLVLSLISNGIETNKTYKNVFPIVPNNLFFDWLRGYIDGDGCYYTNKATNTYMHITCCSKEPLLYVQNKLKEYSIKSTIYSETSRKYRLMCTDYNSLHTLVNHLYYQDDLFYLQRKYEKIKHLLGSAA